MQEEKFRKLNFAKRFNDLVESSGKKQKELAVAFGASEGALINWKRGQVPKSEELLKIAQYFGTSMEWLLTGEDESHRPQTTDGWRQRAVSAEQNLKAVKSSLSQLLKKI